MTERFRNGGANWWIAEPNRDRCKDRVANRRGYDSGAELADYLKHPDLAPPRATSSSIASNTAFFALRRSTVVEPQVALFCGDAFSVDALGDTVADGFVDVAPIFERA
jgi:hypothetical protein